MTKNKEGRMIVPRITLNEKDAAKATYLMERSYLSISEMIKALIRKEYSTVTENLK